MDYQEHRVVDKVRDETLYALSYVTGNGGLREQYDKGIPLHFPIRGGLVKIVKNEDGSARVSLRSTK